jgi:hypothetical protein
MLVMYCSHPYLGDPEEKADAEQKVLALKARCPSVLWLSPLHAILRPYRHDDFATDIRPCLALLKRCDGIIMLNGLKKDWSQSRGCMAELQDCLEYRRKDFIIIVTADRLDRFIKCQNYISNLRSHFERRK